jgi:hypothetical protein
MDNRSIIVRFQEGQERAFLLQTVLTGSGVHRASYSYPAEGSFSETESSRGMKLTPHFHILPRLRRSGAIRRLTHMYSLRAQGQIYPPLTFPALTQLRYLTFIDLQQVINNPNIKHIAQYWLLLKQRMWLSSVQKMEIRFINFFHQKNGKNLSQSTYRIQKGLFL